MIQVVIVKNIFEKNKYETQELEYLGLNIKAYVDSYCNDIFLNGKQVKDLDNVFPNDYDQIIVIPHVAGGDGLGNILGLVAMVALAAFSGGVLAGTNAIFGYTFQAYSFGAYLAAGAIMYLGGRVINALFPQQTASLNNINTNYNEKSQTYGWDLPSVSTSEGGIVGETYGTCIPQPQLLQAHVETVSDSKQYLNVLYCAGNGPIDEITNIRIDNTPIDNFSDVQIETRYGLNNQEPISFFSNTPTDQSVGLTLDTDKALTRSTDSTLINALEITLEWNNGLYHLNDDGSYGSVSVAFDIDYRKTGTKDWIKEGSHTVTAATGDGFRRSFKWNVTEQCRYDVRVTMTSKPSGTRNMTYTTWSILTSYNNQTYSYPNKVLVALRILATNQLSGGIPSVNWRQTRKTVQVYDPNQMKYIEKSARNPIWVTYDILHGCKKLYNINTKQYEYVVEGCKHANLDKYFDKWVSAANYADENILNNEGELEERFLFDAYFDTESKRYTAAVKAAAVGHAALIVNGTNYSVVVDKPSVITQIFGEGRTTVSSVNGSFTSKDERARAIEITYNDSENDFKNTQFTVRSALYALENSQDNTAQLTLFGVSRRTQAYREAVTSLATNERQLQFIELKTDINGLVCEYGDVVGYSHAVSQIGLASGRIVDATKNTITLDKDVTILKDSNYELYIQLKNDTLVKKNIVTSDATTNTLTVTEPFDVIPEKYDVYNFGEINKAVKPFRVVGAERDGDLQVKLKLAEYDEAIYATELNYSNYPITDYTSGKVKQDVVKELNLTSANETNSDGLVNYKIIASWSIINSIIKPTSYDVILDNGTLKQTFNTTETQYIFSGLDANTKYTVTVKCVFDNGTKLGNHYRSIVIPVKTDAPEPVTSLNAVMNGTNIHVSWTASISPDVKYYNVYLGDAASDISACTLFGQISSTVCDIQFTEAKNYIIYVEAVNKSSKKSTAISATVTMTAPDAVTNLAVNQQNRKYICSFTGISDADFYEIRTDVNAGKSAGMLAQTTATNAEIALTTRSGRIYVYSHNKAGIYSKVPTYIDYNFDVPSPPKPADIKVSSVLSVLTISVSIPTNCIGFKAHVVGSSVTNYDKVVYATADYIDISLQPDIYTITVAYYDSIGDGTYSDSVTATVKVEIDASTVHITSQTVFDDNVITSKMLQAGAVTADKLAAGAIHADTLDAISAKIGTLRTATTGARMEIHDNLIMIYDDSNNLRVKMGVW